MLSSSGHEVVGEAENGFIAVEKYRELQPDLVTMDITMPEMNGIEAVKKILAEHPEAKVIMCSAMGQQKVVVEAIEAGAKDFIVKPLTRSGLMKQSNGSWAETFKESLKVHLILSFCVLF